MLWRVDPRDPEPLYEQIAGVVRRALGEGLREDHAEALAAERRGAEHVRLADDAGLLLVVDATEDRHAARIEEQRLDLRAARG